jgi:hypothetical protein
MCCLLVEVSLEYPINLLVYDINYRFSDVAEELKTMLQNQGESVLFTVSGASMVLNQNTQEIDSGLDDTATNSQAGLKMILKTRLNKMNKRSKKSLSMIEIIVNYFTIWIPYLVLRYHW